MPCGPGALLCLTYTEFSLNQNKGGAKGKGSAHEIRFQNFLVCRNLKIFQTRKMFSILLLTFCNFHSLVKETLKTYKYCYLSNNDI